MYKSGSRQRVVVKHIPDQDVEHHIKVLGAKTRRKTQRLDNNLASVLLNDVAPVLNKKQAIERRTTNESNGDIDEVVLASLDKILPRKQAKDASLIGKAVSVSVTNIYNFKTPKKANQMTKFAMESAKKLRNTDKENKTPKKISNFEIETPKKVNVVKVETSSKKPDIDVTTPVRKSTRIRPSQKYGVQEILARVQEEEECDESDESANYDDEDDQDEEESKPTLSTHKGFEMPSASDLYFEAHKAGGQLKTMTSNRTMSRLKTSQITFNEMQAILERIEKSKFEAAKKVKGQKNISDDMKIEISRLEMISKYRLRFQKWMFQTSYGFNLILFGFGSKRKLLHNFCEEMLGDFDKVIINGYFPSLLIKSILNSICDIIDYVTITTNGRQNQVEAICQAYAGDKGSHLFLIVHNIDGANLRNRKAQDIFCRLSQCPRIHIIATIDHINASIIWDQSTLIKFNWLWYDVTTFEWYKDETSYENSLSLLTAGGGVGGSLALSGLLHVIRSLTPNARGIFKLIIENQIVDTKTATTNFGMSFTDLYQICREKFLVNSELTLRSQLTEFLDHKLIQIKKGLDGAENLSIPLDTATLKEYLEQAQ